MAKPKEEKPDGLEITSIGSLHKGPWDKKYWSSSRGKDRYPYPVGFQAVRAHNGSTCKMEIHEGPKGPLFVITSADGRSFSGQTPDIAWEKFQKKGCPRTKIWHGKRFSCKIDGVEFFGFKNPFVQRLLRELVANINGTPERSLLSSSFCNGASRTNDDNQCPDASTYPDLLPYLARPQITKKRSRRCDFVNTKSVRRAGLKRSRPQDLTCNAEDSTSVDLCDHLRERAVPAQEETTLTVSESCESARVANNLDKEERPLDRSRDTDVEVFSFPMATEDKDADALVSILKDCPGVNDVDLCAPDTLDFVQDTTTYSSPSSENRSTYSVKEEITAADMIISEGLVTESHPEEQIGTYNSNASSEKSDFDSFGQEIAKSMMTLLLPQAIPLLKKAPKKKKATISPSDYLPCRVQSQEENNETSHFVGVPSPDAMLIEKAHVEREGKMHNQSIDIGLFVSSFEHTKSVILDSFSDDQFVKPVTNQVILPSNIMEADRDSFAKETYPPITWEELVGVDLQESSACHVETSGSKDIFCYDEVYTALNKKPQKGDEYISESVLDCTFPSKNVFSKEIKNACANLDKKSVGIEICSVEKDLKAAPDCTEAVNTDVDNLRGKESSELLREDNSVKTRDAETDSITQVPNKVYIRKKVSTMAPPTRNYNGPLSESIICRNFGDDCVPETCNSAEAMLPLETHHMSSSDDKLQKEDSEARLGGQSHCLHTEKTTMNSKLVLNNMAPVISQHQTLVCTSESKNTSNCLDPSVSRVENYQARFDKNLLGHENCVELNHSLISQVQGTDFCNNKTSIAQEVETNLDLEPPRNVEFTNELEGIVELVGCYFHPMPVLSLLLSAKGNEIYICVLCGLLVDKDRTLFIYKVAIKGPTIGCPSFVGYTSVMFPFSREDTGREITLEGSGFQFTPDGQCLVLLDHIKTPYCREGRIDCLCSTCTSDCFEDNAVKIVQVKPGYVSVVAKLKTIDNLQCILVCEPNHLVAVGESGRLHLWTMNSTWSAQTEEFVIAAKDGIFPGIVELKRIPKCASLILGHNGFGEFGIWNISQRLFISRFSAPSTSINQFFPINLFSWQRKDHVFSYSDVKEYINKIMASTTLWFSEHNENHSFLPSEGEDIAVWLLVSTVSDSDDQHKYISNDRPINPVRWWRLALLVNNMVILGSALDPRAAVIGASAGQGIIGTDEGHVYMWELSTGTKLGTLHDFKGGNVSCIATDDSRSGVLAVAGDGGQLLVYLHPPKRDAHK